MYMCLCVCVDVWVCFCLRGSVRGGVVVVVYGLTVVGIVIGVVVVVVVVLLLSNPMRVCRHCCSNGCGANVAHVIATLLLVLSFMPNCRGACVTSRSCFFPWMVPSIILYRD